LLRQEHGRVNAGGDSDDRNRGSTQPSPHATRREARHEHEEPLIV
jgi:hypothetical protein